jgi:hypothetical protein
MLRRIVPAPLHLKYLQHRRKFLFGPYDRWPHTFQFDKFYGFIGGYKSMGAAIFDGTVQVNNRTMQLPFHHRYDESSVG